MTKQEFNAIVNDAVKNGAKREDAEAFVISGYHLDAAEFATKAEKPKAKAKK